MGSKIYNEKDGFIKKLMELNDEEVFEIKNKKLEEELYFLCHQIMEINLDMQKVFEGDKILSIMSEQQEYSLKKLVNCFIKENHIEDKNQLKKLVEKMIPYSRDWKNNNNYRQHRVELEEGQETPLIYVNLDLLAIKVIVDEISNCYLSLGLIHSKYKPINDRFKYYICNPKTNMYQSLHTSVFGENDRIVQTQIRTHQMDQIFYFPKPIDL